MPTKRSRTDYEKQQEEDAAAESLQAAASEFWLKLADEMQKDMQQTYAMLPAQNSLDAAANAWP